MKQKKTKQEQAKPFEAKRISITQEEYDVMKSAQGFLEVLFNMRTCNTEDILVGVLVTRQDKELRAYIKNSHSIVAPPKDIRIGVEEAEAETNGNNEQPTTPSKALKETRGISYVR